MAPPLSGFDAAVDRLGARRLGVVGPTVVAAALALWGLGTESLWLDEATSLVLAQSSFGSFLRQAAGPEINATAYYLLLRAWITFGTDEAWVRLLSAILAIATIPVVHVLGRALFGEPPAAIAALVLATNPFFLEFAQEARGYSLALLLSSASTLAFVRALKRSTFLRWAAWAFLAGIGLYAHLFTAFVVAAQLLAVVAAAFLEAGLQPRVRPLAMSTALVGLLAVPMAMVATASGSGHLAHIPPPTPFQIARTGYLVTGGFAPLTTLMGLLGAAAILASVVTWRRPDATGSKRLGLLLVWAWLLVPLSASLTISLVIPVFVPRYLIVMLPAIAFVVALGVTSLRPPALVAAVLTVLVAVSFAGSVRQATTLSKEDWRGAAAIVLDRAEPGDAIAFVSASVAKPFAYYVARSGRQDVAPTPIWPEVEWRARNPIVMIPDSVVTRDRVARYHRVWLVVSHESSSLEELATIVGALRERHVERDVIALRRLQLRLWVRMAGQPSSETPASTRPVT